MEKTDIIKFIPAEASSALSGLLPGLARFGLGTKAAYRVTKAYKRYVSHGPRDPVLYFNAASGICSGVSLLALGSSKILKLTNLSAISEPLAVASGTLNTISDTLDGCCKWHSPII